MIPRARSGFILCVGCWMMSAALPAGAAGTPANVDATRIEKADQDASNWLTYGRTYSEQRFSPLQKISAQ